MAQPLNAMLAMLGGLAFRCSEAGYAGGIMSARVDGVELAEALGPNLLTA